MWVDIVWSVSVSVIFSPVGMLVIFSVVSSINGCLLACVEPLFRWPNT